MDSIATYTNMAKAIKWQIPFASLSGTLYRIDIYDEGYTGNPVQLTAGATPFVTDEDSSEDFFAPIRTQTGSIQVCTRKPDGTMLTLDEILPANNLDHPVRLINLSNSNAIEWQGFLSCEAYSQNYTAIPENLTLSVISVLEAMDSVEVELSENLAFNKIIGHAAYAMKAIETESGMSLFDHIYISAYCKDIMTSIYFYNNVYFDAEEQINGDNIVVEVHSISCKKILEQIAKFFGCCWREYRQNIYLEAIGKNNPLFYQSFANIKAAFLEGGTEQSWLSTTQEVLDIADFEWRGVDHKRDIRQGARRVKLSAKLKEFNLDFHLEETPTSNLVGNPDTRYARYGEVYCNTNETFYSLAEHKHIEAKLVFDHDADDNNRRVSIVEFIRFVPEINYAHTSPWELDEFRGGNTPHAGSPNVYNNYSLAIYYSWDFPDGFIKYLTSYMAWYRDEDNNLQSGLMLCGIPRRLVQYARSDYPGYAGWWRKFELTENNYLFKQSSPLVFSASSGYLNIDLQTLAWYGVIGKNQNIRGDILPMSITMAVKFGNKWLTVDETYAITNQNRYSWGDSFTTFRYLFKSEVSDGKMKAYNWTESLGVPESDGLFVRIPQMLNGSVTIYLYHEVEGLSNTQISEWYVSNQNMFDAFINKLEITHVPLTSEVELRTDRSENVYAENTALAFRDEISIDLDIATDANNKKLATMLWSDATTPVKLLSLDGATVRPEVELLNRLATYYGASRQILDLITKHPVVNNAPAVLPLLKLNGINDGKQYLPLSESRDWQQETCTLKCFETPT